MARAAGRPAATPLGDQAPSPEPRCKEDHTCLLIAVVCDIRSFTSLTARVDDFSQSNIVPKTELLELIGDFTGYMKDTQKIAQDCILNSFKNHSRHYAVKSTGDGFLVAVKVAAIADTRTDESDYPVDWKQLSLDLTDGLICLVNDAKLTPKGSGFGAKTHAFIDKWGERLGYSRRLIEPAKQKSHTERSMFRVAGSMAMGIGTMVNRPETPPGNYMAYDDAYGHAINLAFRLCDQAARPMSHKLGGMDDLSPFILVDRRVARLLLSHPHQKRKKKLHGWNVDSFEHLEKLRGIEESWCHSLASDDENGRRP